MALNRVIGHRHPCLVKYTDGVPLMEIYELWPMALGDQMVSVSLQMKRPFTLRIRIEFMVMGISIISEYLQCKDQVPIAWHSFISTWLANLEPKIAMPSILLNIMESHYLPIGASLLLQTTEFPMELNVTSKGMFIVAVGMVLMYGLQEAFS